MGPCCRQQTCLRSSETGIDPASSLRGAVDMTDQIVTELTSDECWEMLRGEEFGRLAYRLVDEVHITPINYAVDGGSLLFRTAEGNKLLAVVMGSEVAFEIDRYGETSARSVVV